MVAFIIIALFHYIIMPLTAIGHFLAHVWPPFQYYSHVLKIVAEYMEAAGSWMNHSVEIRGRENVNFDGPCVIVVNHQCSLDVLMTYRVMPRRMVAIVKRILMYTGPVGLVTYLIGTVYIDRKKSKESQNILNATLDRVIDEKLKRTFHVLGRFVHPGHVGKMLRSRKWHGRDLSNATYPKYDHQKLKVVIFPEGTRNFYEPNNLLPFKKGAFHMAVQGQIPIVPIVYSSYRNFYSKPEKRFETGGEIIAEVLPPVSTDRFSSTAEDVSRLTDSIRSRMLTSFQRISAEADERHRLKRMKSE